MAFANTAPLARPPIVEFVVDLDCDLPPGAEVVALEESARGSFGASYPKVVPIHHQQFAVVSTPEEPAKATLSQTIIGFRLFTTDERQLVQVRSAGFSFNRLSPYSSMDDYLPEIERCWYLYCSIARPVYVRAIRMRCLNRLPLPLEGGRVTLSQYIGASPVSAEDYPLELSGFACQYIMKEPSTGHQAALLIHSELAANDIVPVILDISVAAQGDVPPTDWSSLREKLQALRALRNQIFRRTVTEKCLQLFQ